ncbi:guanylate-binding protein 1-like [Leptodactylus fuscus]|uniref:guanylate-binding protein 1-like n=1 Tax=Leptodactylus fuscus TaxID=238119 RepID=UPI003F4E98CA
MSGSSVIMESPLCLIKNSEDGKLSVNPEAINILTRISQPVVVVSIVGLYRTGKSYLMNKLAGAKKGFNLGYNVQSETKGIWMWCIPHPTKANHVLVLLDTEGLGDVEKGDKKNDIRIFSLAVLLSSALVYNSMGTINQDAMDKLKLVGEIAELIKVKSQDNDDEEAEFSLHFPIFIWAVRDFHLKLTVDGKPVTEDEYLENALKLRHKEKSIKDEDYNRLRKRLCMYFKSRKCFVFDQPSSEKEDLQNMDNISESQLQPEFLEQTKRFCDYIFQEAEVKKMIGAINVTGRQLGHLAQSYTEAIMTHNTACMEDVAHTLSDIENKAAVQEAVQHYESRMKESIVFPTDTLNQFLELSRQCENEALQKFLKRSFKDTEYKYQTEFMGLVQQKKEEFCKMNEAKSREICEALIKKHSEEHEEALAKALYSIPGGHEKFKQDIKAIKDKYHMEPGKGVQAEIVLQEYLTSKGPLEITILKSDEALTEKQKEQEEEKAKEKVQEMEQKRQELEESQKKQNWQDMNTTLQENITGLVNKLNEENKLIRTEIRRVIEDKERERDSYEKQGFRRQANMYQAQIDDYTEKEKQLENPVWYKPIKETFKRVAADVLPILIEVGGNILKSEAIGAYNSLML